MTVRWWNELHICMFIMCTSIPDYSDGRLSRTKDEIIAYSTNFSQQLSKTDYQKTSLKSLCGCLIGGRHCMHVFIVLTGVSTLFCWVKQLKTVLRVFESVQRVSCRKTVRHWNSHPVLCNPLSSKEECSVQFKMFSTCFAKLYISLLGQMTEDCWEFLRVYRECLMQEISQALKSTSSFM